MDFSKIWHNVTHPMDLWKDMKECAPKQRVGPVVTNPGYTDNVFTSSRPRNLENSNYADPYQDHPRPVSEQDLRKHFAR